MMSFCSGIIQAQLISHPVAGSSLVIGQNFKVGGADAGKNFYFLFLDLEAWHCSNSGCICIFAYMYYGLQKQHGEVLCVEVIDVPKIKVNGSIVSASVCSYCTAVLVFW